MFIECVKNNGVDYLRIVEGYTYKENGVTRHRRRVIRNIGPLSRFDDGEPEYLKRLRLSFKQGTPMIPAISDLTEGKMTDKSIIIRFNPQKADECYSTPKNIGYFILDAIYDSLGIYDVFNSYKSRRKIEYDLNGLAKLLIFGRVLFPDSKTATFEKRDSFLFPLVKGETVKHVYNALDALNEKANTVQKRMNLKVGQRIGRDTEVCFYDVTNYYFEIECNDADILDDGGNLVSRGLRKKGVSKENRNEPIVQMGLFIDANGIPISYHLFPGNNIDQTTLRPAMRKTIDDMNFARIIVVADGGLNSGPNIAHILDGGNGYIVSKSTKKSDKTVKAWILSEDGYKWNETGTFKVKSQIRTRKIKAQDGTEREITEKLVCFWSRRHYERERRENEQFVEYLESVIAFPDKLKDKPKKIERFLNKTEIDKATGKAVKTTTSLSLNIEKIRAYLDLMGYYTIMSSEVDKSDEDIIAKYHGLSRIEDSFRVTKTDLQGRPVYVRTPEHINAHFLICFIALSMIRIIQHKILLFQGKEVSNTQRWELGLSAERIQKALFTWQADPLPGGYFRTTKPTADLTLILNALGISACSPLPIEPELRKLKQSADAAFM